MEFILKQLNDLGFDSELFMRSAVLLAIGSVLMGVIGRYVFGKRSVFHCSASSAIGILFVYVVTIAVYAAGAGWNKLIAPLPFLEFTETELHVFVFEGKGYPEICSQILSMVILSFLVNIIDSLLPRGKKFFTWLVLRILTVAGAMALHLMSIWLIETFLPQGFMQYAPFILLALLAVLVLVGGLKILVGAVLTTVNPIIGVLYTFFFANIVGKAITKAMLTTAILSALIYLLGYIGFTVIAIAEITLLAFIPLALILLIIWFVISKLFDK